MEAKITKYFELKREVDQAKKEMDVIKTELRAMFGSAKVDLEFGADEHVRIQTKTRNTKKCAWETLKVRNAELYAEVVSITSSSYIELRKIVNT